MRNASKSWLKKTRTGAKRSASTSFTSCGLSTSVISSSRIRNNFEFTWAGAILLLLLLLLLLLMSCLLTLYTDFVDLVRPIVVRLRVGELGNWTVFGCFVGWTADSMASNIEVGSCVVKGFSVGDLNTFSFVVRFLAI